MEVTATRGLSAPTFRTFEQHGPMEGLGFCRPNRPVPSEPTHERNRGPCAASAMRRRPSP